MKRLNAILTSLFVTTASIATSMTPASAAQVQILGATYGGSGCPTNSASVSVSPDGQELSILFD